MINIGQGTLICVSGRGNIFSSIHMCDPFGLWRSRSRGQSCWGSFLPHRLAEGATCGHFNFFFFFTHGRFTLYEILWWTFCTVSHFSAQFFIMPPHGLIMVGPTQADNCYFMYLYFHLFNFMSLVHVLKLQSTFMAIRQKLDWQIDIAANSTEFLPKIGSYLVMISIHSDVNG